MTLAARACGRTRSRAPVLLLLYGMFESPLMALVLVTLLVTYPLVLPPVLLCVLWVLPPPVPLLLYNAFVTLPKVLFLVPLLAAFPLVMLFVSPRVLWALQLLAPPIGALTLAARACWEP